MRNGSLFPFLLFLCCATLASCQQRPPGDADDEDFVFPREGSGQRAAVPGGAYHPPSGADAHYGTLTSGRGGGGGAVDSYDYGSVEHRPDDADSDYGSGDGNYDDEDDYDDDYNYYYDEDYSDEEDGVSLGSMDGEDGDSYRDPVSEDVPAHNIGVVHEAPPGQPRQPEVTQAPDRDRAPVYGGQPAPDHQPPAEDDFMENWDDLDAGNSDNDLVGAPDLAVPAGDANNIDDSTADERPAPPAEGMDAKALDPHRSFFQQPGILAVSAASFGLSTFLFFSVVLAILCCRRKESEGAREVGGQL